MSIIDLITITLIGLIELGLGKLAYNDYLNGDYIGSAIYVLVLIGFNYVLYTHIKEIRREIGKEV